VRKKRGNSGGGGGVPDRQLKRGKKGEREREREREDGSERRRTENFFESWSQPGVIDNRSCELPLLSDSFRGRATSPCVSSSSSPRRFCIRKGEQDRALADPERAQQTRVGSGSPCVYGSALRMSGGRGDYATVLKVVTLLSRRDERWRTSRSPLL